MAQNSEAEAMSGNEAAETSAKETATEGLTRMERDKMTRRAALAKLGIRAGLGVLAAISIDDLARMTTRLMDEKHTNNRIANQLAREFKDAGVAFADDTTPTDPTDSSDDISTAWTCSVTPSGLCAGSCPKNEVCTGLLRMCGCVKIDTSPPGVIICLDPDDEDEDGPAPML